ncbi:hypothetical protein KSP39_PZI022588 [Platanthera zijinensis]|uniref:Uncharacterized protein n=1 Tax=Platanthera zijinensis TaxID=2320716 RepID=A0AAP0FUQ1_9ASPA
MSTEGSDSSPPTSVFPDVVRLHLCLPRRCSSSSLSSLFPDDVQHLVRRFILQEDLRSQHQVTASLIVVPVIDPFYVRNSGEIYGAFYVTVGVVIFYGVGEAFVHGGVIGFTGELPEIYMQGVFFRTEPSISFSR